MQTNAAGDNIHLIDPATNKVVGEINGIEVNHGVAAAPDGSRLYVTNEAEHTLDVVDGRSLKVTGHVPLSGRPNNLSIGKDGRYVYVAIVAAPGAVDVIDTSTLKLVKTIPTKGGIHNTFVTPDGKFVIAGSIVGRLLTVIDVKTKEPVWSMPFDNGVRPIGFETKADGSTKRMFVQISDFHGFYVVDFAARKEVQRVTLPELPKEQQNWDTLQGSPSHGIGVAPDGKTLWVCSKVNSRDLRVFDARSEAARRRDGGPPSRLADVLARQPARLRRQRGIEFGVGRRHRDAQGDDAGSGRPGAEAEHHGAHARRRTRLAPR